MTTQKTAEVLWDVDEGVLVLGNDVEIPPTEPMKVVTYLQSLGVNVSYYDRDQGTTTLFEAIP